MMSKQFVPRDCTTNLTEMETFLSKNNFLSGTENPGQIDSQMIDLMLKGSASSEMQVPPNRNRYPNSFSWFWSLSQFSYKTRKLWNPLNISPELTDSEGEGELEPGGGLTDSIETQATGHQMEIQRVETGRVKPERDEFVVSLDNGEYYGFMETDPSFKMSSISHPKSNSTHSNNLECRSIMKHLDNDVYEVANQIQATRKFINFEDGKSEDLGVQGLRPGEVEGFRSTASVRAGSDRKVPMVVSILNQPQADSVLHLKDLVHERDTIEEDSSTKKEGILKICSEEKFEPMEPGVLSEPKSLPAKPQTVNLFGSQNVKFGFQRECLEELAIKDRSEESTGIFRISSTSRKSNTSQGMILFDIDIARNYSYILESETRPSVKKPPLPIDLFHSPKNSVSLLKCSDLEDFSNTPDFGMGSDPAQNQNFFGGPQIKPKQEKNKGERKGVIYQFSEMSFK